jgi:hypothetical protein
LDKAAYEATTSGNTAAYDKLAAEVEALHDERNRLTRAQNVIAEKIAEGRATLDRLGKSSLLKTVQRIGNQRTKYAGELAEQVAGFARTYQKIFDMNAKLSAAWPYGPVPDGALVGINEVVAAVSEELFRVHPVAPLGTSTVPLLPGARFSLVAPDADQMRPLTERIEAANGYLLKLIEDGPSIKAEQPAQTAAPSEPTQPEQPTTDFRSYVPRRVPLAVK